MQPHTERTVECQCYVDAPLADVFERFRSDVPVDDFIHDAENVWEWIDGRTRDGMLGFNISRQHGCQDSNPNDPVRLSLAVRSPDLEPETVIGQLSALLGVEVTRCTTSRST